MGRKRSRKKAREEPVVVVRRSGNALSAFVLTALAVAAILYGAVLLISRTEGFRTFVTRKLEAVAPLGWTIGACRLTARGDLVLRNVRTAGEGEPGRPGVRAGWVRLRGRPTGLRSGRLSALEVREARVMFKRREDGGWAPDALAGVAGWLDRWTGLERGAMDGARGPAAAGGGAESPAQLAAGKAPVPRSPDFAVGLKDVDVVWWGADGVVLARAEGLNLSVTPVNVPGRRIVHVLLTVGALERYRGGSVSQAELELLATGDRQLLLAFNMGGPVASTPRAPVPAPLLSPPAETPARPAPPPETARASEPAPGAPPPSNPEPPTDARSLLEDFIRVIPDR